MFRGIPDLDHEFSWSPGASTQRFLAAGIDEMPDYRADGKPAGRSGKFEDRKHNAHGRRPQQADHPAPTEREQDGQRSIAQVSDEITATYLRDEPQPSRLVGVARAAMLMAAQQQ